MDAQGNPDCLEEAFWYVLDREFPCEFPSDEILALKALCARLKKAEARIAELNQEG